MLWIGEKAVAKLWVGNKPVAVLYRGAVKIWSAISSCFGSGFWLRDKIWSSTDAWRNN